MKRLRGEGGRAAGLLALGMAALLSGCAGPAQLSPVAPQSPPPEVLDETAFDHFANGTILMLAQNYAAAAEELEKALAYQPNSREVRFSLGECYFSQRQFDKAVAAVSAIEPKDAAVWGQLASFYRFQGREEDAYRAYREMLAYDSTNADAYWYLAQLETRRGRMDAAVSLMEKLTQVRLSPATMAELGRAYWRAGQTDRAVHTLRMVLDGKYGAPPVDAFGTLADLYINQAKYAEAAEVLRQGLQAYPEHAQFRERLVEVLIDGTRYAEAAAELEVLLSRNARVPDQIRLAMLYFQIERYHEADGLFSLVARTNPDQYAPHLYLGRLLMMRTQYDSAEVELARAVEIDDENPEAYWHWANALLAQDSVAAAIRVAREGEFAAQPKGGLQFLIGVTYSREQNYDSAVFWLAKALKSEPSDLRIRFSLGAAYERAGRFAGADTTFQMLIAIDSNHAGALNYLGYMYAERGINLDTSLRLIKRAVSIEPENGAYLDSYAWVLFKLGQVEEAEIQMRKALERSRQPDPTLYDHFGDILARLGRLPEARAQWAKALELDPANDAVKQKLQSAGQ